MIERDREGHIERQSERGRRAQRKGREPDNINRDRGKEVERVNEGKRGKR